MMSNISTLNSYECMEKEQLRHPIITLPTVVVEQDKGLGGCSDTLELNVILKEPQDKRPSQHEVACVHSSSWRGTDQLL